MPASVDAVVTLLASENYVCDRRLATVAFLGLALRRPLFLEGEPGVGKTELAKALARGLGTRLLRVQCHEGLDIAQTAYEWNVARQMMEIRLAEATHDARDIAGRERLSKSLYSRDRLIERPLLQALTHDVSPVLLIDELDRADEPFDAFLLEVLAENQLTIPELGTVKASAPPIVVVTSNRTREIHDALKRRCLYHWVDYPDAARELEIVRRRSPGAAERLRAEVVGFVQRMRTLDLFKSPGIAETIDWINALVALNTISLDPASVHDTLGVLLKHRDDIAKLQGADVTRLLVESREAGGAVFADNVAHFARVLRRAGVPVGPDRVIAALQAIEAVGVARRGDVHAALSAVMLDRHEQQAIFDAAFAAFWRDPKLLEQMMAQLLPKVSGRGERERERATRANRLADALAPPRADRVLNEAATASDGQFDCEATFTFSDRERLQSADFESMTAAEFELAKRLAEELPLPFARLRRRRHEAGTRGRIDLRATMLAMARQPTTLVPRFSQARREWPALVVLLDISGSMDRYARLMLHYVHGLTRRYVKVHTLTFGTRLTHITRALRNRDPDVALALASTQVRDWKGGTRIASCLDDFNRHWARRLLGANAAVLLVSDGLDTDEHGDLARAARQLRLHARQIVWLNPLLRFDRFEPRAAGIRAILPHVDRFLPVHNLASLADLGQALRALRAPCPVASSFSAPPAVRHGARLRNSRSAAG